MEWGCLALRRVRGTRGSFWMGMLMGMGFLKILGGGYLGFGRGM